MACIQKRSPLQYTLKRCGKRINFNFRTHHGSLAYSSILFFAVPPDVTIIEHLT